MPSFDVVSEVDMQEVRNAVDQASRELSTRFDFPLSECCTSMAMAAKSLGVVHNPARAQRQVETREKAVPSFSKGVIMTIEKALNLAPVNGTIIWVNKECEP